MTFLDNCNCTYTSKSAEQSKVSIAALTKIMSEMPEIPKIFTMPIEISRSPLLPKNYIVISNSVADALEQAINETTDTTAS